MALGSQARAWLEVRHLPGVGPRVLGRAMERITDVEAFFAQFGAGEGSGLPQAALDALRHRRPPRAFYDDCHWLERPGRHLVLLGEAGYPDLLRDLPEPPPLLYVEGDPTALQASPTLALVGSREASRSGCETARAFARDLAGCGFTIVSGLARGIDAAAHRGALDGGGITVAVQGRGPDRVYPAEHGQLAAEMVEGGALISEFPVGTPPRPGHFPQRNRLISGLCLGVLVMEAGAKSGALTTARWAGSQGREVLAVPGSIHSTLSRGPNGLIREGAKLVEELADIAEELRSHRPVPIQSTADAAALAPDLTPDQALVADCVDFHPTTLDQVVARSGLTADRVSAILLELEIRGIVGAEPGGRFTRTPAS
ncbi:DNA-processing protein DprA [Thiohalorhabdus sp.]|uniref:DNA-processing protein DprA n=1 Tax=Thiohalorhabdus sp. TaxID=3094134 RepID=UPI002FC31ABE